MPGVPSGRGCDGCRKQKKKCDQRKPSCSRCLRLKLDCLGAGELRYKFITNHDQAIVPANDRLKPTRIVGLPQSATDLLVASMIETMKPSVDLKFNLAWAFGPVLEYVPQRLGRSAALDAAAKVIIAAHSNHCVSRYRVSPDVLVHYSRALVQLRLALDDAVTAQSPETLCAIMLLLISQALIGCENRWTGHGEGAARLLKARGDRAADMQGAFEASMLASLSASVLFEGIFNPNIVFTPREWTELIGRWFDQDNDGCKMMRCLSLVPGHLFRGRRMIYKEPGLIPEARSNHQTLQALTFASRQSLAQIQASFKTKQPGSKSHAHAFYLRIHALNIAVLIILNRVLFALDVSADWDLHQEARELSNEVLSLAQEAKRYAPLGSSYIAVCLCAAWIGCSDYDQRTLVERLLLDFYNNDNQTAMLVDVLRVKSQEMEDLRAARTASLSVAL